MQKPKHYFTAQIKIATGFVGAVTATTRPLTDPPDGIMFVPLDDYHEEYAGGSYNSADGTFSPRKEG